jgi:hypothetical protein
MLLILISISANVDTKFISGSKYPYINNLQIVLTFLINKAMSLMVVAIYSLSSILFLPETNNGISYEI